MSFLSRHRAVVASALFALGLSAPVAQASDYPNAPIKIVVPFSPGGTTDIIARLLGNKMAEDLGARIVVENRPGANGIIGSDAVAKSAPDGYTLVIVAPGHASNISLQDSLPYDTLNDFAPIALLITQPSVLVVHPSVKFDSVGELVAAAKAKPGEISYASGGVGSSQHLAGAMFEQKAGIELLHVAYKGSAPAEADLVGGQVQAMFASVVSALPKVQAGQIKALAVTSSTRSPAAPELPTIQEAGVPGYEADAWAGLLAPAGTPPEIIERLNKAVHKAMAQPDVKERLDGLGAQASFGSPADFDAFIRNEASRWAEVVESTGMKNQ